jgi:hypothetical protein
MLETHIMMSLLIFGLTFLLVLCLIFLINVTIAHMILVHERVVLCLDTLVSTHAVIVVFVPRVGMIFPTRGVYSYFAPSRFDGPCFSYRGSRPTRSNGAVQRIMKTSLGYMVKCWISKIFLTNPNIEPSTFFHSM